MESVASKDALARGMELFGTKGRDVPLLAMRYVRALCSRVGECGEVFITAYSWYAEKEEGYTPAEDDNYCVHDGDKMTQDVIAEARTSTWQPHWWAAEKE